MTIYVTGDTHNSINISKLNKKNFPKQADLTKNDFLIIAGDFGMVWNNDDEDRYWQEWLSTRNYTTLFVDGNHENFDLLETYPIYDFYGGKARFITDSIIQLLRGQVYIIDGYKFFIMGGAWSHDQWHRKVGKSWWPQEQPTKKEMQEGLDNLEKHNWEIDYVITHTCPASLIPYVRSYEVKNSDTTLEDYLDIIYDKLIDSPRFKQWYFGHWHVDTIINDKTTAIYHNIERML